jgi:hypothetical protein
MGTELKDGNCARAERPDCIEASVLGYGWRPAKRKRALLGSNPPRNSRLETHSDDPGSRPQPTGSRNRPDADLALQTIGVDLPIPQKPIAASVR